MLEYELMLQVLIVFFFKKKVYDYLNQTPACNQTREAIIEFVERSKEYDLAKAEILNIINLRPIAPVEIFPVICPIHDSSSSLLFIYLFYFYFYFF